MRAGLGGASTTWRLAGLWFCSRRNHAACPGGRCLRCEPLLADDEALQEAEKIGVATLVSSCNLSLSEVHRHFGRYPPPVRMVHRHSIGAVALHKGPFSRHQGFSSEPPLSTPQASRPVCRLQALLPYAPAMFSAVRASKRTKGKRTEQQEDQDEDEYQFLFT
jgi:hypothetical protein